MKFFTPLEQFEITVLQPFNFFGIIDFSFTNASFFLILVLLVNIIFFSFSLHKIYLIPTFWQSLTELLYIFILGMVKDQAGKMAIIYFPFIFFIFVFVLFSNLIGLAPLGFTVTGHLIITFVMAFSINLSLIIIGFYYHGLNFFKLFVPNEAPIALVPLIVVIEVVSYSLRTFSLSIRLFANMMAGHTLLNILSSFVFAFFKTNLWFLGVLPFILVFAVVCLEFGIAFLQAYVFTILTCIYLNDSINLH